VPGGTDRMRRRAVTERRLGLGQRAADLRHAFDRAFAEPPRSAAAPMEGLLAIGAGGDAYALRLAEITGLFVDKKLAPLPSLVPELLGIAGFRGALVPVFDLRALLGHPAGPPPRWLVLAFPRAPVGLAFDRFDGHLHVPGDAIAKMDRRESGRAHVHEVVRAAGAMRPIVDLPSVLDAIKNRTYSVIEKKE